LTVAATSLRFEAILTAASGRRRRRSGAGTAKNAAKKARLKRTTWAATR